MFKEPIHTGKLVEGCKINDRRAQEQLYKAFYKTMMNLCLRYTKDESDAKAVLNAGFFRVFKSINNYNPSKATLYTWLRAIIFNCCLDHIKSKQGLTVTSELNEADDLSESPAVSIKMDAGEILAHVRKLPTATQAVFNLYIMEGYGHKEIAILLQISEGTSKWHLSEARKNLKQQLMQSEK